MNISCTSEINNILYIAKNIINIIMIITPILGIVIFSYLLIKMTFAPEEKKLIKNLTNSIKALIIIFFIPMFITIVMYALGDNNNISRCYLESSKIDTNSDYNDSLSKDKTRSSVISNPRDYEKGDEKTLDFSCKSKIVKAQFSCPTLRIVENHLHELNANNFHSIIDNQYGGDFGAYAKSLGGVFGEYYGKKMPSETEADFQRAAEYVVGWMYMYGWTYWGSTPSASVFWKNGFYENYDKNKVQYYNEGAYRGNKNFDVLISAQRGLNNMASACGELEIFAYDKMGISRKKQLPKVSRLRDLKVGDGVYFFNHKVDKTSEKDWGIGRHNVIVGEVYSDYLVFYDVGSYFPKTQNYKRKIYFPNEAAGETDMDAIRKEFPYYDKNVDWGMRRWHEFK